MLLHERWSGQMADLPGTRIRIRCCFFDDVHSAAKVVRRTMGWGLGAGSRGERPCRHEFRLELAPFLLCFALPDVSCLEFIDCWIM